LPEDEEKYKQEIQRLQMRIFMLENEKRALKVKLKDQEKVFGLFYGNFNPM